MITTIRLMDKAQLLAGVQEFVRIFGKSIYVKSFFVHKDGAVWIAHQETGARYELGNAIDYFCNDIPTSTIDLDRLPFAAQQEMLDHHTIEVDCGPLNLSQGFKVQDSGVGVDLKSFQKSLALIDFAMSDDKARFNLTGVKLYPTGRMVATNTHVLAATQTGVYGIDAFIPDYVCKVIKKLRGDSRVSLGSNSFTYGRLYVQWKDFGRYPDIDSVIPDRNKYDQTGRIYNNFKHLTSTRKFTTLPIVLKNDEWIVDDNDKNAFGLRGEYLNKILKAYQDKAILRHISSDKEGLSIIDHNDQKSYTLLMPVRL
jgi:hypothetical protein